MEEKSGQGKENSEKPSPDFSSQAKSMLQKMAKSGAFYVFIAVCFIGFLLTKNPVFGVLVAFFIFALLLVEAFAGAATHGWKKEITETLVALAAAGILWFGFSFILGTSSPLNGIVTCSMLPELQRGDMVVLQGGGPNAPVISASEEDLASLSNPSALVSYPGGRLEVQGSMFAYCTQKAWENANLCEEFKKSPENFRESRGAFEFTYKKCEVRGTDGSSIGFTPCIDSVEYRGQAVSFDKSNGILVYSTTPGELYYPNDIIHRAFVRVEAGGKTYYITRGDNNVIADVQAYSYSSGKGNLPPSLERVKGHVLFKIPFVGYFKLFISFFQIGDLAFVEPQGCQTVLQS